MNSYKFFVLSSNSRERLHRFRQTHDKRPIHQHHSPQNRSWYQHQWKTHLQDQYPSSHFHGIRQLTFPFPCVAIAILGPLISSWHSFSPLGSLTWITANSGIGGSSSVEKEDGENERLGLGSTTCLDGEAVYVRFETRLGISRSLGVSPARMTLSELAMHSIHSVDYGGSCRWPEWLLVKGLPP